MRFGTRLYRACFRWARHEKAEAEKKKEWRSCRRNDLSAANVWDLTFFFFFFVRAPVMLGDSSRSSVFHALHRRHANPRKCSTALSHAFRRLLGLVRNRSGQGQGFWLTVLARRTEGMRVRGRVKSSGFTASCGGLGGSGSETRFASQPRESWVRQMPVFDFGLAGWICLAWPAPGLFSETGTANLHGARAALVTSNSKIELSWRVWDVFAEPRGCSSACVCARAFNVRSDALEEGRMRVPAR